MSTDEKAKTPELQPDRADVKELVEEDGGKPLKEQAGVPEAEESVVVPLTGQQKKKRDSSAKQLASLEKARETKRQKRLLAQQAPVPAVPIEQLVQQSSGITQDHLQDALGPLHKKIDEFYHNFESLEQAQMQRWNQYDQRKAAKAKQVEVPTKEIEVPMRPAEPLRGFVDDYPKARTNQVIRF